MSLLDQSYAVLDFETNGLAASRGGEVIESGIVRLEDGRISETFHSLSRPALPIPATATRIHGITDAMVAGCPRFADVLPGLLEFVGDRIVVAHNAGFDRSYLDAAAERAGTGVPSNPFLDTLRLSRKLSPELDHHDLESLCVHHRIPRAERHRALADAQATGELLRILLELAEEAGVRTPEKLLDLAQSHRTPSEEPRRGGIDAAEQVMLEEAIVTGDRVEIVAETRGGGLRPVTVIPYGVDEVRGAARLVAFDVERGVTRIFRLDRVVTVGRPGTSAD